MAFEFPRANPNQLFFPTVHIHDGKVHPEARFDHALYCQTSEGEKLEMTQWSESALIASQFLKVDKTAGIVEADGHVYLRTIRGRYKNDDVIV
jgi:hypothetical protein